MKAKDKAEELIEKFMPHSNGNSNNNEAIQCALICVDDEIYLLEKIELEFTNKHYDYDSYKFIELELASLKQVKQEILNRQ